MATAVKDAVTFQTSTTHATSTSDTTPSSVDLSTSLGCVITAEIINAAATFTAGCYVIVQVSNDNSDFMEYARATAGLGSGTTYTFTFVLPAAIKYAKVIFGGNTGTSADCTVEADGIKITSIG